MSMAREIAPAPIIRENEYDIGPPVLSSGTANDRQGNNSEQHQSVQHGLSFRLVIRMVWQQPDLVELDRLDPQLERW